MTTMTPEKLCIYCGLEKPANEFSLEHIFPQALGGALCNDLFKTRDVCRRCNSIVGTFVDGAFLKSWFITNDSAFASQDYLDLNSPTSISPLSYMGPVDGLSLAEDEICEMWLGPCGSHFYHIHRRDEPQWNPYAGGNPIERREDPGRAYLALTTHNPQWMMLLLRSFKASFRRARRYPANFGFSEESAPQDFVLPADAVAEAEAQRILSLPTMHEHQVAIDPHFDLRFLGKLALGVGYKLFGNAYLETQYSTEARRALWAKDAAAREGLQLRGSGFLSGMEDQTGELLGWSGAYVVRLHAVGDDFVLSMHLSSGRVMHVSIATSPELWASTNFDPYRNGVVYLVAPQTGRFIGPIDLPSYIAHRTGVRTVTELQELEAQRTDPATLPPCRENETPPNPHP